MNRLILLAGAATLAIATPALAGPHGGHGGGHGGGAAHAQRGGGGGGGHGGGGHARAAAPRQHGGGGHVRMAAPRQHGGGHRAVRTAHASPPHRSHGHAAVAQRSQGHGHHTAVAQQQNRGHNQRQANARQAHGHAVQMQANARGHGHVQQRQAARQNVRAQAQIAANNRQFVRNGHMNAKMAKADRHLAQRIAQANQQVLRARAVNGRVEPRYVARLRNGNVYAAPAGVEWKLTRPVIAPAVVEQVVGQPLSVVSPMMALSPLPAALGPIYPATPQYYYQYGGGYVYRVNRTSAIIDALLPLFGLGYGVGQPFPAAYPYYMPTAYEPFYPQTPYMNYRYAAGYMYGVDPYSGMIENVIPTLGYGYGVGQILPASYSVYNVPYAYRPLYYDTSDYYYRYAPGAIYQVDPTTSLITAVAALLSGGMTVGQPIPAGYSVYNVPLSYRATYYDTPDAWYRYADGGIYRINPMNGIVTERVVTVV